MERPGFVNKITTFQVPDGRSTGYPTLEEPGLVERWRGHGQEVDPTRWNILAAGESVEASRALAGRRVGRYSAAPDGVPAGNPPGVIETLLSMFSPPPLVPVSQLDHPSSNRNLKPFRVPVKA